MVLSGTIITTANDAHCAEEGENVAKKRKSAAAKDSLETTRPIGDEEPRVGENIEKHWGDPQHSQPRELVARSEKIMGITWLAVGALISLILEVLYLGVWMPVGDGSQLAFPITVVIAGGFNFVLSRTALLWTRTWSVASIPLYAWFIGFVLVAAVPYMPGSHQSVLLLNSVRTVMLLSAGVFGGVWPLLRMLGQPR